MTRSPARRIAAVVIGVVLSAIAPAAALATPGVPDAPVALFTENFEHGTAAAVVNVTAYSGADVGGATPGYQTDPSWAPSGEGCNGLVLSFAGNDPFCGADSNAKVKAVAQKVGTVGGDLTPDDNHALVERRDALVGGGQVEVRIAEPLSLDGASGHFLVGATDVAVLDCAAGSPLFSFVLTGFPAGADSIETSLSPAPQDLCLQGHDVGNGMTGGTIYSDGAVFSTFTDLTLDILNANDGAGSFHALDNLVVAQADPQLDHTFASGSATTGNTAQLTFTVTNTTDLATKTGWSFTEDLPPGLSVVTEPAGAPSRASSCAGTTVTAPAGGHTVTASGAIPAGQASCTVTVGVTSPVAGTFALGAGAVTTVGLRKPGSASLQFKDPVVTPPPPPPTVTSTPAACADGIDNDGDGLADANDPGCVVGGVYTPQKNSEVNVAPLAQCARGLQLTDVFGRDGRTVLRGVAGPEAVGKTVAIFATATGKRVATAIVKGDLSFATTAPLPPRAIRNTNGARYQARLGSQRSLKLKFARRMTETVARRLGATGVRISGRVTKPFADPRAKIVVRGSPSCQSDYSFGRVVVARDVNVSASGKWSTTITLPAALRTDKVYLRAQTRVRLAGGGRSTFATYTLLQGVALK
jgi:hypothetical protein